MGKQFKRFLSLTLSVCLLLLPILTAEAQENGTAADVNSKQTALNEKNKNAQNRKENANRAKRERKKRSARLDCERREKTRGKQAGRGESHNPNARFKGIRKSLFSKRDARAQTGKQAP